MEIKEFTDEKELRIYLENQIKTAFEEEGIGKCTERYLNNMYSQNQNSIVSVLCTRLTQAGHRIEPLENRLALAIY